jgi:signal transduction histidine kinase
VNADPDRLAQVIANLVENALKFARSRISVAAALSQGQAVLWVDDDGPGIAPADLQLVFERLWTAERSPGRQIGSGLGLAIVAELAGAMGGHVRADSPITQTGDPITQTGGTRMVLTLSRWTGPPGPSSPLGTRPSLAEGSSRPAQPAPSRSS